MNTKATETKTKWAVVDTNATALKAGTADLAPRVHDVAPGVRVELYSDRKTPVDEKYARLFLKDRSFLVYDAEDNEVLGLNEQQVARHMPQEVLAPDCVIANLAELTSAALRTRCMVHPKAADLPPKADRSLMIDFLTGIFEAGSRAAGGNEDRIVADADAAGGLDPADDAMRLLEGA